MGFRSGLRQNWAHHFAGDVGEAEVAAGVAVGEAFVVEAQQVEHGGVQVVDAHGVLDRAEPELVGGAMSHAAPDAATRQPDAEAVVVVVAAELGLAATSASPTATPAATSASPTSPAKWCAQCWRRPDLKPIVL